MSPLLTCAFVRTLPWVWVSVMLFWKQWQFITGWNSEPLPHLCFCGDTLRGLGECYAILDPVTVYHWLKQWAPFSPVFLWGHTLGFGWVLCYFGLSDSLSLAETVSPLLTCVSVGTHSGVWVSAMLFWTQWQFITGWNSEPPSHLCFCGDTLWGLGECYSILDPVTVYHWLKQWAPSSPVFLWGQSEVMVAQWQGPSWWSPSLSRSKTWPSGSSWNPSVLLALVFKLWRHPLSDALLTSVISPITLKNMPTAHRSGQNHLASRSERGKKTR